MLSYRSRQFKLDWLKWVIDFLNADLESTSTKERLHLALGLDMLSYPLNSPQDIEKIAQQNIPNEYKIEKSEEILEKLSSIQNQFKKFLTTLIESRKQTGIKRKKDSLTEDDILSNVRTIQIYDFDFKPYFAIFADGTARLGYLPLDFNLAPNLLDKLVKRHSENKLNIRDLKSAIDQRFRKEKMSDFLSARTYTFGLLQVLDGMPTQWIQRCKGCNRFFLNPTDRKKVFCNYPCAQRSIARMKREKLKEDPKKWKAYLKKQKEYSARYYREKIKGESGPNVKPGRKEGK